MITIKVKRIKELKKEEIVKIGGKTNIVATIAKALEIPLEKAKTVYKNTAFGKVEEVAISNHAKNQLFNPNSIRQTRLEYVWIQIEKV